MTDAGLACCGHVQRPVLASAGGGKRLMGYSDYPLWQSGYGHAPNHPSRRWARS